jgi:UDP-N-acetylglucosamine 3-dehydrogenase
MMGRNHARVLRELRGVDLVAIADVSGDHYGAAGGLAVLPDLQSLIAAGIDAAVVAVPTRDHEQSALILANARIHTLIEKPIAHSIEAGQRIVDAFSSAQRVGAVGHIERFNPAFQELRRRLEDGQLGEVYQIATSRQGPFPYRIADVGVGKDLASHDIDLTAWVAQSEYASVSAFTSFRRHRDHEDMIAITGKLRNGVIVNHLVNWLSPRKERVTVVTGARGAFVADTITGNLTFYENESISGEWDRSSTIRGVAEVIVTRHELVEREPLQAELEAFRDAILGTRHDVVTLAEGLHALEVVEVALESARIGKTISI